MNFEPMTLTWTLTHFVEEEEPFEPGDFHLLTISSFLSLKYRVLTSNKILTEPLLSDNYFSISS